MAICCGRLPDEDEDEISATGLDAAVDGLTGAMSKLAQSTDHPEKRQKAQYAAFEQRQLPIIKETNPGLKLSQYKERIFDMWKTSPENPINQVSRGGNPHSHVCTDEETYLYNMSICITCRFAWCAKT
jgi:Coiled-coil domain-containing protein 124 /Oxs1